MQKKKKSFLAKSAWATPFKDHVYLLYYRILVMFRVLPVFLLVLGAS